MARHSLKDSPLGVCIPAEFFMSEEYWTDAAWKSRRARHRAPGLVAQIIALASELIDLLRMMVESLMPPEQRLHDFALGRTRRGDVGRVTDDAGRRQSRPHVAAIVGAACRHLSALLLLLALVQSPGPPALIGGDHVLVQPR